MIYLLFLFSLAEQSRFSTIASSASSKCQKCIYHDFIIHKKCFETGFFQKIENKTISCFPEDNGELMNGLKILAVLLVLSLFFISISIWRKKILLSR